MSTRALLSGLYTRFGALASTIRFGQFVSVGVLGAACESVVLLVLLEAVGVGPVVAKLVGAETSIAVMFAVNEHWTFATEGETSALRLGRRFLTSNLVRAGGVLISTAVLLALLQWVDVALVFFGIDFWPPIANLIGIGVVMFVNYTAESLLTWRVHTSQ